MIHPSQSYWYWKHRVKCLLVCSEVGEQTVAVKSNLLKTLCSDV